MRFSVAFEVKSVEPHKEWSGSELFLDPFPRIRKADSVGEPVGFSTLQPSVA